MENNKKIKRKNNEEMVDIIKAAKIKINETKDFPQYENKYENPQAETIYQQTINKKLTKYSIDFFSQIISIKGIELDR